MIAAIVPYQHADAPAPPIPTRRSMWYMEVGGSLHTMVANIGEKGLCLPEALMTAAGLLLGSCAGLLAARRLCAISTRKRAGEGGPEAAQASWEREGSLSSLA